jgi:gamma-glutamyltranspeptidase
MHTLSPTLWTKEGMLDMVLGTRGGDQQPQFLSQFAAHHYHADLCVKDAQTYPRWDMEQPKPGTDSALTIEPRFGRSVVTTLTGLGHSIADGTPWNARYGPISAIDIAGGNEAAADPRVSTSAALTNED